MVAISSTMLTELNTQVLMVDNKIIMTILKKLNRLTVSAQHSKFKLKYNKAFNNEIFCLVEFFIGFLERVSG